jgi:hypothetical protein
MDPVVVLAAVSVLSIVAATVVGRAKGRTVQGFLLGLFLGLIGLVVVAVLPPSRRTPALAAPVHDPTLPVGHVPGSGPPAGPSDVEWRRLAMAEAMRRDPSLVADDPVTLGRLEAATGEVERELRLARDRDAVLQSRAADDAERARTERDRAEVERVGLEARAAAEARAQAVAARQAELAAMSPTRRWLASHDVVVVGVVGAVLLVGLVVWMASRVS